MKRTMVAMTILTAIIATAAIGTSPREADARAGSGRSIGSKGSRSYSRPVSPPSQPQQSPQMQPRPMTPPPYQQPQPAGGGFFRSMAGGIVGGMLGGMLFRSLGFGGGGWGGGMGGSGIGLFEILLLGGIGYMIYRFVKNRRQEQPAGTLYQGSFGQQGYGSPAPPPIRDIAPAAPQVVDVETGLSHIRRMDSSFDEERFCDQVMDIFFKIQGAWMNRDLAPVRSLLTEEMHDIFRGEIDTLRMDRRINRLENIAVREVSIAEVWQESGQDYITALIYANLLDYTTDETTGQVVAGSRTDPVKFEEYWTFTRPVGSNPWRLAAIEQK